VKATAVSSGMARSSWALPEPRQIERRTRIAGLSKGCSVELDPVES
jgi:hypothetical protein